MSNIELSIELFTPAPGPLSQEDLNLEGLTGRISVYRVTDGVNVLEIDADLVSVMDAMPGSPGVEEILRLEFLRVNGPSILVLDPKNPPGGKPMIKPTIGRVVWYWPPSPDLASQPQAAIITWVWTDELVNLTVFPPHDQPYSRASVPLYQGVGDKFLEHHGYCEWMPYQIGQAAKAAASELHPVSSV